jgi:PAS domain S-box-containing protein
MPNVDLRSVVLLVGIMGLLMSVIIFFLRRSLPPSIEGLREWAAAPAIVLVSMVLLAMRGLIPDVFSILCGNLLLLAGCLLYHIGAQRFFGVPAKQRSWIWPIVSPVAALLLVWCSLIEPDYGVRLRLMAALMFGIFVSLVLLVHTRGGKTFAGRFTAAVLCVQSVVILLRFIATFVWPSGTGLFEPFLYQTLYIASFAFTMLLLTVGTVLLTTERMRVEFERSMAERSRAEDALRVREERFHALFERASDGIMILSLSENLVSVNDSFARMHGYTPQEMKALNLKDLDTPQTYASLPERMERLLAGESIRFEVEHYHKDGHIIPLEVSSSLIFSEEEPLIQAFHRDITERRRAEKEILQINAELEKRVEQRTHDLQVANFELESFSYSVSHDLRAPLRSVEGYSGLLDAEYGEKLDERGKDYIKRVRAGAIRMGDLIEDLLVLSRISRQEMHRGRVNLSALAREEANELMSLEPERRVEWTIAPDISAEGDSGLLRIALQNLIGNAWKYSSKRETAQIEFGVGQWNGASAFVVRDNGDGFDMARADKLFGAFQRLHSPEEFPGTGIGLATVARIVRRHGGTVGADGKVHEGASFYFTL